MNHKILLAKMKMIESGIVPARTSLELTSMLESMGDKESRKAKRKFRKIWKKISKKRKDISHLLEDGNMSTPTKSQKRNRSVIVFQHFIDS